MNALVATGPRTTANTSTAAPTTPRIGAGLAVHARRQTNGLRVRYTPSTWPITTIATVAQKACMCIGAGLPAVGTNIRVSISHAAASDGDRKTASVRQNRVNVNATRRAQPGELSSAARTSG